MVALPLNGVASPAATAELLQLFCFYFRTIGYFTLVTGTTVYLRPYRGIGTLVEKSMFLRNSMTV